MKPRPSSCFLFLRDLEWAACCQTCLCVIILSILLLKGNLSSQCDLDPILRVYNILIIVMWVTASLSSVCRLNLTAAPPSCLAWGLTMSIRKSYTVIMLVTCFYSCICIDLLHIYCIYSWIKSNCGSSAPFFVLLQCVFGSHDFRLHDSIHDMYMPVHVSVKNTVEVWL